MNSTNWDHVCNGFPEWEIDEDTGEEYCAACREATERQEHYEQLDITHPLPPCRIHETPRYRTPLLGLPFCDLCDREW